MLALQIALGIVLGFIALRYLRVVLAASAIGAIIAVVVGLVALILLAALRISASISFGLFVLVGVAIMMLAIQYSARALGYGYVALRAQIKRTPAARNLFALLGIADEWLTSARPVAEIARIVGDKLLGGLCLLATLYVVVAAFLLFVAYWAVGLTPDGGSVPALRYVLLAGSFAAPALVLVVWLRWSRRSES